MSTAKQQITEVAEIAVDNPAVSPEQRIAELEQELAAKESELQAQASELEYLSREMIRQKSELELINAVILEGEARLRAILENFAGEIWSVDREFNLSHANTRFVENHKAQGINIEMTDSIFQAFDNEEQLVYWKEHYQNALNGNRESFVEQRMTLGGPIYLEVFLNPIQTDSGEIIGVTGLNINVTKRIEGEVEKARLNRELNDAAHRAGMAEVATGVLHNIGNILNSVNTSSALIQEILEKSKIVDFQKANSLLKKNLDKLEDFFLNNPKGPKLLTYYLKLEEQFVGQHETMKGNSQRLRQNIEAMRCILAAQQGYAKTGLFFEKLLLSEVVEDALTLTGRQFNDQKLRLEKDFDATVPAVLIQKSKVIQILINLLKNAIESMEEKRFASNTLTVKIHQDEAHSYVRVSDTGAGISRENLKIIFTHGFTTKKTGHGFGLHASANHMTEMGGSMWAESEGEGKGATFVLRFKKSNEGAAS